MKRNEIAFCITILISSFQITTTKANVVLLPDTITVSEAIKNLSSYNGTDVFVVGYLNSVYELTALTDSPEDFSNRFQTFDSYRKLIQINNYKHNAVFIKGMEKVRYKQAFGAHRIRRQFKGFRNEIVKKKDFLFSDLPKKVLIKGILLKDRRNMTGALLLDVELIIFIE